MPDDLTCGEQWLSTSDEDSPINEDSNSSQDIDNPRDATPGRPKKKQQTPARKKHINTPKRTCKRRILKGGAKGSVTFAANSNDDSDEEDAYLDGHNSDEQPQHDFRPVMQPAAPPSNFGILGDSSSMEIFAEIRNNPINGCGDPSVDESADGSGPEITYGNYEKRAHSAARQPRKNPNPKKNLSSSALS